MKTIILNNQPIEVDETLTYADFFLQAGQPHLMKMDLVAVAEELSESPEEFDGEKKQIIFHLTRWVHEAPRKRHFRELKRSGVQVMSNEQFFEEDDYNGMDGADIIDWFENTGKLAVKICEAFGQIPMKPIRNDDPIHGVTLPDPE